MEKTNCLIFLEDHGEPFKIAPIAGDRLKLEEKLAIFVESRPFSNQIKALRKYARGEEKRSSAISLAENSQDYFRYFFERGLELVEFAVKSGLEFEIIPLDIRSSKKTYEQFKKEDEVFPELLKNTPELSERVAGFFEEHAFGAWYTKKQIEKLEQKGFSSFVYSVGYSHYASLAHYLRHRSPEFVYLEKGFENKNITSVFFEKKNLVSSHYRMLSFFLSEYRGKYCIHCGEKCC